MIKKNLTNVLMIISLTMLTVFSLSCETTKQNTSQIAIPMPVIPEIQPVKFSQGESFLILTYDDYRKLENNIIEYRRYIAELEAQVIFYRGEEPDE